MPRFSNDWPGRPDSTVALLHPFGATAMDLRYARALRDANAAWAQNHATDAITLQELRRRAPQETAPAVKMVTAPSATQMAVLQPQLAAYGNLGTKLNLFA